MGGTTSFLAFRRSPPSMAKLVEVHRQVLEYCAFFENPEAHWYLERLPYMLRKVHEWNANFPPPGSEHLKGGELLEYLRLEKSASRLRGVLLI